jgi:hypothetical protein
MKTIFKPNPVQYYNIFTIPAPITIYYNLRQSFKKHIAITL